MKKLIKKILLEYEGFEFMEITDKFPQNHRFFKILETIVKNIDNPQTAIFFGDYDNDVEVKTKIFFSLDNEKTVINKYKDGKIRCQLVVKIEDLITQIIYDAAAPEDEDPFQEQEPHEAQIDDIPSYIWDDFENLIREEIEMFIPSLEVKSIKFV